MSIYKIFPLEVYPKPKSKAQRRKESKTRKCESQMDKCIIPNMSHDWSVISSILSSSKQSDMKVSDIVWELQKAEFQVLSIEPIFRTDLWDRFAKRVGKIRDAYKYPYCPSLGQIDIVFHGTSVRNVESIIKNGFFVPQRFGSEDGCGHESENGQMWGPGIYCTRSTNLAAVYGDDQIIFMCAVIMGRPFRFISDRDCEIPGLRLGYDSHISPDGFELVVFREDQIVPLCVLHIGESEEPQWGHTYRRYERVDEEEVDELCQPSNRYVKCRDNTLAELEMLKLEMW